MTTHWLRCSAGHTYIVFGPGPHDAYCPFRETPWSQCCRQPLKPVPEPLHPQ